MGKKGEIGRGKERYAEMSVRKRSLQISGNLCRVRVWNIMRKQATGPNLHLALLRCPGV